MVSTSSYVQTADVSRQHGSVMETMTAVTGLMNGTALSLQVGARVIGTMGHSSCPTASHVVTKLISYHSSSAAAYSLSIRINRKYSWSLQEV